MNDKLLQQCQLRMVNLLTSKTTIKKDAFQMIEQDGKTKFIRNGLKPIACNATDWTQAGGLEDGASARKRIRLVLKHIKILCDEARKLTIKLDRESEKEKLI